MLQVTSSLLTCGRLSRSQRFAGMSLGKQHTAKKTNKLKFFTGRLSALLHHRARPQKKKNQLSMNFCSFLALTNK